MKLIEFLISKDCEGWKWPNGIAKAVVLDGGRSVSFFYNDSLPPALSETLIAPRIFVEHECVTLDQYEATLAASKPEWDGKGLPPVGAEVEAFNSVTDRWYPVRIVYSSGLNSAWIELDSNGNIDSSSSSLMRLRPIRSEADKKRDEAINEITRVMGVFAVKEVGKDIYDAIAAGKIPHIRID